MCDGSFLSADFAFVHLNEFLLDIGQAILLSLSVSSNKEANELFALVNWAEFRRRGFPNPLKRHSEYLTQLIYNGETKFRLKGKTVK